MNKNVKCFGNVSEKLENLHYRIKLQNGKMWNRHVNQMRAVGTKVSEGTTGRMLDFDSSIEDCNSDLKDSMEVHVVSVRGYSESKMRESTHNENTCL